MRNVLIIPIISLVFCSFGRASDVVFPHVASGPHYTTELKITNQDSAASTVLLSFFTPSGNGTDIFSGAANPIQLGPRNSAVVRLKQPTEDLSGWARASSASPITGVLQISYIPSPGVFSSSSVENLNLISTALISGASNDSGRRPAFAICNPEDQSLDLDLDAFDANSQSVGKSSLSVPARSQRALFVDELGISGASSLEIRSRSGLFSAVSLSQSEKELFVNQVSEAIQKRFIMQQEKIDLNFPPSSVRVHGALAVITGSNGINFFNLATRKFGGAVQLEMAGEVIAFHPSKPLVAVAGVKEVAIIDTNTFSVVRTISPTGVVAFDNLTETLAVGQNVPIAFAAGTQFTAYDQNFQPVAKNLMLYGGDAPQARNGTLVMASTSATFDLFRLPSLQKTEVSLPGANASTQGPAITGDNVVVLGPRRINPSGQGYLLSFYYIDSNRIEQIPLGIPADSKTVQGQRVYITTSNRLTVVDIVQRRVISTDTLSFSAKDMDFDVNGNALIALDKNSPALWIVRLAAR